MMAGLFTLPALVGAVEFGTLGDFGLDTQDTNSFGGVVALGKRDVRSTIGKVINVVLGILGIVAVVIIVAGGFTWMTAAGNEDKVGTAKKMISQGVIGLVIVFAAWGIASFVISQLGKAAKEGP